jgi:hypothetical protein
MKLWKIGVVFSLAIIMATAAFGACIHAPKGGIYTTENGTMLGGRVSEAWCSGVGPGRPGNTENAMSWNGASLGLQWTISGMTIDANGAVETARYFAPNGNGWINYATNYTGGTFWLSGNHLWGDGSTDFTGAVTYYNVSARVSYIAWHEVGVTSNIVMTGTFDECPNCTLNMMGNGLLIWKTGYATPKPANYPPFLCSAVSGELFDACCPQIEIYCEPVSTESSTWGGIKALYR